MASPSSASSTEQLLAWYNSLHSWKLDIVGDFAGKELFAIHGESMLLHCIREAKVDFEAGFQVVHAVYAVETFLRQMKDRGCNFHVLWFENHEELCIPPGCENNLHKYLLVRAILVRHFRSPASVSNGPGQSPFNFLFPSLDSAKFRRYLADFSVRLFLCSDGRRRDPDSHGLSLSCISVIYNHASLGYAVGLIDDLEFTSSKVQTPVLFPKASNAFELKLEPQHVLEPGLLSKDHSELLPSLKHRLFSKVQHDAVMSAREAICLIAVSHILSRDQEPATKELSAVFLVHLAVLKSCSLSKRACRAPDRNTELSGFLAKVSWLVIELLDDWVENDQAAALDWDVFDLLDGRLFGELYSNSCSLVFSKEVKEEISMLFDHVMDLSGVDISDSIGRAAATLSKAQFNSDPSLGIMSSESGETFEKAVNSALHFSHPVFDQYLEDVRLTTDKNSDPESSSRIFQELTHWHNSKRPIDPKHVSKPLGFFARKRNQKFMADTTAYSASLTNSTIDPEIISTETASPIDHKPSDQPEWKKTLKQNMKAKNKKGQAKSGTQQALEAAKTLKAEKDSDKSAASVTHWTECFREFEKEPDLVKRYLTTVKYYTGLKAQAMSSVGPEIMLYLCSILVQLWARAHERSSTPTVNGNETLAILWAKVVDLTKEPLRREICLQAQKLAEALRLPPDMISRIPGPQVASSRKLLFEVIPDSSLIKLGLPCSPLDFQLAHCGPYLERSFNSAPDPRVPFYPDEWQRHVLDAIDAEEKSLFVVAPTSAGKTFISFYAMKKILQSNDDDVLVYVAPTKALVNQIAAEIQARFSKKTYKHEGKSVWAIHTRDYRVNNPIGAQILVCVPHILQIMLLAPSNAERSTSWSNRVKRIIFDEVHCIGQAEDGIIWEQLLLLAPCPIIALSATVGNPLEFKSWLEGTQKAKGFDLEMIVHEARYSDLRKLTYIPREEKGGFEGLERPQRLYVPGLDQDPHGKSMFHLVHPVGAIINLNRDTLGDMTLEARDCLSLWHCMAKHQTEDFPLDSALRPEKFLPPFLKKADVLGWEKGLKAQLRDWMKKSHSPFLAVREELRETFPMLSIDRDSRKERISTTLTLLADLLECGALPAILFNFDRSECEITLMNVLQQLIRAEDKYKEGPEWEKTMKQYRKWEKSNERAAAPAVLIDSTTSKQDIERQQASRDWSIWESFDPEAPVQKFSFADSTKLPNSELQEKLAELKRIGIRNHFIVALQRGLGVHHAGMNRQYRQVVEMLFRKGFLTVVIATGTLALGINMPCKTVVFAGDSVFLTALNYRQASGRAGRRGFDVLGNVVFHGIDSNRVFEIVSSGLPDLRGQFPVSTTLVLRVLTLLYHTGNSEYAVKAARSLLSQTRVYLGGPAARMSIKHHVRFSIEYLRRQHLLSAEGVPLNFSGLVGHLYFTENAVFAFHSLLRDGYFHEVCKDIEEQPRKVLQEVLLVLCHLFCRHACFQHREEQWIKNVVRRSSSIVLLPPLPQNALNILKAHNRETLGIFRAYAATYVDQHLSDTPDHELPFTKLKVGPEESMPMGSLFKPRPPTKLRSPFAALSGFTDSFESIKELCSTARAGVFLEDSAVPYIPIYPDETKGVPWNAYIYDFFQHGQQDTLVRDNGIKSGDVWFRLKDFSLILAAIVTSLTNFIDPNAAVDDADMIDVQDAMDEIEERLGFDDNEGSAPDERRPTANAAVSGVDNKTQRKGGKGKKKVLDSWEDDESGPKTADDDGIPPSRSSNSTPLVYRSSRSSEGFPDESSSTGTSAPPSSSAPAWASGDNQTLLNVHKTFKMLQQEFDDKFRKEWA